jgi:hypothetical protein
MPACWTFWLKRLSALSMLSFGCTMTSTNSVTPQRDAPAALFYLIGGRFGAL